MAITGACSAGIPLQPVTSPGIASARISPNSNNVLSALVSFDGEGDSARVVYVGKNQPPDSTPYSTLHQGTDTIAILGLRPGTTYRSVIQVSGAAGLSSSDTLVYTTGKIPELLGRISISTTGASSPGLTLTSAQVGVTRRGSWRMATSCFTTTAPATIRPSRGPWNTPSTPPQ